MRIEPEIDGVSVILVGSFNPAIFTPAWFAMHDLLPAGIADSADLAVAHKQMTMFNADWLRLEVTPDQFNVETVQAPHVRIHDLVLRVFGEHLHHNATHGVRDQSECPLSGWESGRKSPTW